jgi:hypothetical protein
MKGSFMKGMYVLILKEPQESQYIYKVASVTGYPLSTNPVDLSFIATAPINIIPYSQGVGSRLTVCVNCNNIRYTFCRLESLKTRLNLAFSQGLYV